MRVLMMQVFTQQPAHTTSRENSLTCLALSNLKTQEGIQSAKQDLGKGEDAFGIGMSAKQGYNISGHYGPGFHNQSTANHSIG